MSENKVYVVVYNDNEDGTVEISVFADKKRAVEQIERAYAEAESYLEYGQRINAADYDHNDLVYFSVGCNDDEQMYECFLREETIQ